MSTIELEVQKAELAREILNTADASIIQDLWLFFHSRKPAVATFRDGKIDIDDLEADIPQWEKDFIDQRLAIAKNHPERLQPIESLFQNL